MQTILAFATHETEGGGGRERVSFLVTELLSGETLSHRVRRQGPLRSAELDRFVRDLCDGLDAIHGARALHGDITGASVLLVPEPGGSFRAVLTDLAFLSSGEGDEQAIARAVGSPAYRAPEHLTGGKLHRATDVFSLGAVIYEAVTARLPFTGGNLLALDFRQLEEQPRPPGEIAKGLEPAQERAILRCLERSPADRFERAHDLLRAMQGESVPTPRFRQAARTLGAASLLIALMLGGSALLSWVSVVEDRRLGVELVRRSRPSIAVMPLRPAGSAAEEPWIAVAVGELVRLELAHDDTLRVAPREAVVETVRDRGIAGSETLAPDTLRLVRTLVGVEKALVGSCRVEGEPPDAIVTLDLCVQDSRTGETVGAVFESGPLSELPQLAARASARIFPIAGVPDTTRPERAPWNAPWSPAGLEAWARGLSSLDARRSDQAVSALLLAATIESENAEVHHALSQAMWAAGAVARATDAAKRAWESSQGLSRERELELELRYAELRNDPNRLIEAYRRMIRTYPDRIDHGFGLVGAFVRAGDVEDATRALRSLQSATLTPLDPRLPLMQSRILSKAGRHAEAITAASDASDAAASIGALGLEAEAEVERALAAAASGDDTTARAAIARATGSFRARGDLAEAARITAMSAALDQRAGRYDTALDSLREAERIYRRVGQRQGIAATQGSIAVLLASRGRHRDAAKEFASALDDFVTVGDRANATRSRIGLAESLIALGALPTAESQLRGVVASAAIDGATVHHGLALLGLARIETARGRVRRARELLDQAAGAFEAQRYSEGAREVEILRGFNAWLDGDGSGARRILERARNRAIDTGNEVAACHAALPLARIDLISGDAEAAARAAAACIEPLLAHGSPAEATFARAIAALAAFRDGDRAGAVALLADIERSLATEEDFAARAAATIARETIRGGRPQPLLRLASEADNATMKLVELDALLAASALASRPGERAVAADALARAERLAKDRELPAYAILVEAARGAPRRRAPG